MSISIRTLPLVSALLVGLLMTAQTALAVPSAHADAVEAAHSRLGEAATLSDALVNGVPLALDPGRRWAWQRALFARTWSANSGEHTLTDTWQILRAFSDDARITDACYGAVAMMAMDRDPDDKHASSRRPTGPNCHATRPSLNPQLLVVRYSPMKPEVVVAHLHYTPFIDGAPRSPAPRSAKPPRADSPYVVFSDDPWANTARVGHEIAETPFEGTPTAVYLPFTDSDGQRPVASLSLGAAPPACPSAASDGSCDDDTWTSSSYVPFDLLVAPKAIEIADRTLSALVLLHPVDQALRDALLVLPGGTTHTLVTTSAVVPSTALVGASLTLELSAAPAGASAFDSLSEIERVYILASDYPDAARTIPQAASEVEEVLCAGPDACDTYLVPLRREGQDLLQIAFVHVHPRTVEHHLPVASWVYQLGTIASDE